MPRKKIVAQNVARDSCVVKIESISAQWRNGLWSGLEQLLRAPDLKGAPDESVKIIENYSLEIVYTKSIKTGVTGAPERKSPKGPL